jgi:putative aldouronate transport system permease protein
VADKKISIGTVINYAFIASFCFLCFFPFYNVIVYSFNDSIDAIRGGLWFWPRVFSTNSYRLLLTDQRVFRAYQVTVTRTLLGVLSSVLLNALFAYAYAQKDLVGKTFLKWMIVIPLYFSGGMIPLFIVLRNLGLVNKMATYVVPYIYGSYMIIILYTFFRRLPQSLEEAAMIDGAGYGRVFLAIILPISSPVLAYIALFQALWHWNDWFIGATYVYRQDLMPIQTLLLNMIQSRAADTFKEPGLLINDESAVTSQSLQMAMIVIATVPILMVYPFLQKYFVRGIMLGSIKG